MRVTGTNSINKPIPVQEIKLDGEQVKNSFNANQEQKQEMTEKQFIKAIEDANKIELKNTKLQFSIHEKTKEVMIKILDADTDEVVKEIPPEKILDMIGNLIELSGIFVDKKA